MQKNKLFRVIFTLGLAFLISNSNGMETLSVNNKISMKPKTSVGTKIKKGSIKVYTWTKSISIGKYIRKFPYPYKAMLAISSDIDDTTVKEFEDYHKFLNTNEMTEYGKGLGLDIGDSFWMYMGNNRTMKTDYLNSGIDSVMTFFKGLDDKKLHNADLIKNYFDDGWIDSIHTFGDFSVPNSKAQLCTRNYAIEAWNALNKWGIHPTVWINHGTSKNHQNFGPVARSNYASQGQYLKYHKFLSYQQGDNPESPYYNSDLDIKNGIHYLWDSVSSTVFGVDFPIYIMNLRDGHKIWGFHRYTNEYKIIKTTAKNGKKIKFTVSTDWLWDTPTIYQEITDKKFDEIIQNHQYSIVAQHFGLGTQKAIFNQKSIKQLNELKSYQDKGKILVARTSRLLNYALAQRYLKFSVSAKNNGELINIKCIDDPIFGKRIPKLDDVRGITFYTSNPYNTTIAINNVVIPKSEIKQNPGDETGEKSIEIQWFKPNYTDYTKKTFEFSPNMDMNIILDTH